MYVCAHRNAAKHQSCKCIHTHTHILIFVRTYLHDLLYICDFRFVFTFHFVSLACKGKLSKCKDNT